MGRRDRGARIGLLAVVSGFLVLLFLLAVTGNPAVTASTSGGDFVMDPGWFGVVVGMPTGCWVCSSTLSGPSSAAASSPPVSETGEWLDELVTGWVEVYKKSMTTLVLLRIVADLAPAPAAPIRTEFADRTGWQLTERGLGPTARASPRSPVPATKACCPDRDRKTWVWPGNLGMAGS